MLTITKIPVGVKLALGSSFDCYRINALLQYEVDVADFKVILPDGSWSDMVSRLAPSDGDIILMHGDVLFKAVHPEVQGAYDTWALPVKNYTQYSAGDVKQLFNFTFFMSIFTDITTGDGYIYYDTSYQAALSRKPALQPGQEFSIIRHDLAQVSDTEGTSRGLITGIVQIFVGSVGMTSTGLGFKVGVIGYGSDGTTEINDTEWVWSDGNAWTLPSVPPDAICASGTTVFENVFQVYDASTVSITLVGDENIAI